MTEKKNSFHRSKLRAGSVMSPGSTGPQLVCSACRVLPRYGTALHEFGFVTAA